MARILVTGGCGYIGAHTIIDLLENGLEVVSIDNNSRSSAKILQNIKQITGKEIKNYSVNLCNRNATMRTIRQAGPFDGIIHFAAFKSVPESLQKPLLYYHNNLQSMLNVLKAMQYFSIPHLVFSSSCSVYGNPKKLPVTEKTPLGSAESPYAMTKQICEKMAYDHAAINDGSYLILRYFNPVGAHPSGKIGQLPLVAPENLCPVITETAIGKREKMTVFGNDYPTRDGTCVRDYIHVMDIAHAHTLAFQYLAAQSNSKYETFNLGSGIGITVLEAIKAFEEATGQSLHYEIGPRRPGDVIEIYADNSLANKKLAWIPKYSINEMMKSAWDWELFLQKSKE